MRSYQIYALIDPLTLTVRYVGKTSMDLKTRLRCHVGSKKNKLIYDWAQKLAKVNLRPVIVGLELAHVNSGDCERKWIRHYEGMGLILFNVNC